MVHLIEFETKRLGMRQRLPADREPFAMLNSDPRVMAFFPFVLTRTERDARADRCHALIEARGCEVWAAECKATRAFMGFVGLHLASAELPFAPVWRSGGAWRLRIGVRGLRRRLLRRCFASVSTSSGYLRSYLSQHSETADLVL